MTSFPKATAAAERLKRVPCVAAGVVRPPRRPQGWEPGGPEPLGDQGRPELQPGPGEDLCFLSGNFRLFQRQDGHRWSLDDLATAWFATQLMPQPPATFLDLGCGIGSVLMMLAWRFPSAHGVGIEAQTLSAGLARRSLCYNGLAQRVSLFEGDFRDKPPALQNQVFDLITGTPPYFADGAGIQSDKPQCAPCRFEHRGGVQEYCRVAATHLSPDGVFVLVTASPQAASVRLAAAQLGLSWLQQLDVVPREGKAPLISLFALAKREVALNAGRYQHNTIVVRSTDLQWTPAFQGVRLTMGMPSVWR